MIKNYSKYNRRKRYYKNHTFVYEQALREIKSGKKESCWMWYIFPQHYALGTSRKAVVYGIANKNEASLYLEDPVLGNHLRECCVALLEHKNKDIEDIFDTVDAVKLKSSMTLFANASHDNSLFLEVIDTFFNGEVDERTIDLLNSEKLNSDEYYKFIRSFRATENDMEF